MKTALKMIVPFLIFAITASECVAAEGSKIATEPTIKCKVTYSDSRSTATSKPVHGSFVEDLKLKTGGPGLDPNYQFDQIVTLEKFGRSDLLIWIAGNYYRNSNQFNAYLRSTAYICRQQTNSSGHVTDAKCFDHAYAGDIFSRLVTEGTIYHSKKIQMNRMDLIAKEPSAGIDILMNYRLTHGHPMIDDVDLTNQAERDAYWALFDPSVQIECSVRDDGFGVIGVF
jgi:hypothetical protein